MVFSNTSAKVPEIEQAPDSERLAILSHPGTVKNRIEELSGTGTLGASSHPSCLKRNWHL